MWQEIDPTRDCARDIGVLFAAMSAITFMGLDLYVHPSGGVSLQENRERIPFIGGNVGNAVVSGMIISGAVIAERFLQKIDSQSVQFIRDHLIKAALATMLVTNVDIEMVTSNNEKEFFSDILVGITTGTSAGFALRSALNSNRKVFRPTIAETADELFG